MFYLANGRIYLAECIEGIYPELELRVNSEGCFYFQGTGYGLTSKPEEGMLLTKGELIAKIGFAAERGMGEPKSTPTPGKKK